MKTLLRADLIGLLKNAEIYLLILLLFFYVYMADRLGFSYLFFGLSQTSGADVFSQAGSELFRIFTAAFAWMYFRKNLSDDRLRPKIVAGYARSQVVTSLTAVYLFGQVLAVAAAYGLAFLLLALRARSPVETEEIFLGLPYQESVTIGAPTQMAATGVGRELLYTIPCLLAIVAFCLFVMLSVRGSLKTIAIVGVCLGLMFHFSGKALSDAPQQYIPDPDFNYSEALRDDMTYDEIEAVFDSVPLVENPDYPGPFGIFLQRVHNALDPFYGPDLLRRTLYENEEHLHDAQIPRQCDICAIGSCCEAAVFTLAGYLIFKKRDLN